MRGSRKPSALTAAPSSSPRPSSDGRRAMGSRLSISTPDAHGPVGAADMPRASRSVPLWAPCGGSRQTTASTTKNHSRLAHQNRAKQWFPSIAKLLKRFTSKQSQCPYWLAHYQKGWVKAPSDRQIYIKFPEFWEVLTSQDRFRLFLSSEAGIDCIDHRLRVEF